MGTRLTVTRTCFVPSPNDTTGIMAASFYSRAVGPDLYSVHWHISRSDTCDVAFTRRSSDNGRTWSAPQAVVTGEARAEGTFRRHLRAGYADPYSGRFLTLRTEGVLPTDHPLEGMRQWQLFYGLSADGGDTFTGGQIILEGEGYDADHPLPGVYRGRSCAMVGDLTCVPLTLPDGTLLVPAQASVLGPDGTLLNPAGFTYTDALVIRGRWQADGRLAWEGATRRDPPAA